MTDFAALLRALTDGRVDFMIVGGIAAAVHGAARATYDLDIVYSRAPDNLASEVVTVFGLDCRCLSLRRLIAVKRAAGRPKDLEAIAELEVIAEEQRARDNDDRH